jgi:hypothetical protein
VAQEALEVVVIKQVTLKELKGVSKNTLDKVLSYRVGKKENNYWVFPCILIGYISQDNGVNNYNNIIRSCLNNGISSLQIINS